MLRLTLVGPQSFSPGKPQISPGLLNQTALTYEIKQRKKGWFWVHRRAILSVAVPVAVAGGVAEYFNVVPSPLSPFFGAASFVSVVEILYISMVHAAPQNATETAL
jgi:phage shock protein PspC (stress-responsive transcriptional regulator)